MCRNEMLLFYRRNPKHVLSFRTKESRVRILQWTFHLYRFPLWQNNVLLGYQSTIWTLPPFFLTRLNIIYILWTQVVSHPIADKKKTIQMRKFKYKFFASCSTKLTLPHCKNKIVNLCISPWTQQTTRGPKQQYCHSCLTIKQTS